VWTRTVLAVANVATDQCKKRDLDRERRRLTGNSAMPTGTLLPHAPWGTHGG